MQNERTYIEGELVCYHCGDICNDKSIVKDDKIFCCTSCKLVYEILEENNLCKYYTLDDNPGISPPERNKTKYEYLEDEQMISSLVDYTDGKITILTLQIPQMHCSSCIWLLENLYKLNNGIVYSRVDFPQKKLNLKYLNDKTSLKQIAELLDSLGYEQMFNLEAIEKSTRNKYNKKLYYKIGIAGFAFGNIMLFSFPEYLGLDKIIDPLFRSFFGYLNLIISLPVFFYCSSDYFISAYKGIKNRIINIDFPLSLGILVIFLRSAFEILSHTGAGYSDSMTGLVFFLLIGKLFQNKTYDSLNFERSYKSYFPLSVTVMKAAKETTIPLSKLKIGNRMIIRNGELIPADSILFRGEANIDYSFATGESIPVNKVLGEVIYAGGRQYGPTIELEVIKNVSQSYLTQLWNSNAFVKQKKNSISEISNIFGKYFTYAILIVALVSTAIWMNINPSEALNVFTAVLIVACPCALALSMPFTLGNMMRIFGKNKFYIKNTAVLEKLSKINTIVFDKTGTITLNGISEIEFIGSDLNNFECSLVKSLARNSTHPLSRAIYQYLNDYKDYNISDFREISGHGISGSILNNSVKLGSSKFMSGEIKLTDNKEKQNSSEVFLSINEDIKGYFSLKNSYREGLKELIGKLSQKYELHLLSGDNENEKELLKDFFNDSNNLHFNQAPENKLDYIKALQLSGKKVLMIGDGLNDAGALKQSDVGISISEDINSFSPMCDAILDSDMLIRLHEFIVLSSKSMIIIIMSFIFSLLYNIAGLSLAVKGLLTPINAAILMPVSSISVVLFCVIATNFIAKRKKFSIKN